MDITVKIFQDNLKYLRGLMTPAQRKKAYSLVNRVRPYPIGTEREYARRIRSYQVRLVKFTIERLNYYLPRMLRELNRDVKFDGINEDIEALIQEMYAEIDVIYGAGSAIALSISFQDFVDIAQKVLERNKIYFEREIKVMAGIPLQIEYEWWPTVRNVWLNENYRIVKSLSQEYVTKLNTILVNGLQSGWSIEDFQAEISKLSDKMTGYRARLIARDQIGKLNSYINEQQSRSIGMTTYIWRTAQDEFVRGNPNGKYPRSIPSHYIMDELFCSWDDATIYSDDVGKTWNKKTAQMELQHPGRAIACFPGDISVKSYFPTEVLYRRRYEGRMITLITSDGFPIRCTPNHPILRGDGVMVEAHSLNKGDKIVKVAGEQMLFMGDKIYNGNPTFEDIFCSFSNMLGFIKRETSQLDFHGDGMVDEEVNIVPLYGELWADSIPEDFEGFLNFFLASADMCLMNVPSDTIFMSYLLTLGFPNDRFMRIFSKLHSLFYGESAHTDVVSVRAITELDSLLRKISVYYRSTYIILFGERKYTSPIDIFTNELFNRQFFSIWSFSREVEQKRMSAFFKTKFSKPFVTNTSLKQNIFDGVPIVYETADIVDSFSRDTSTHVYNLQSGNGKYTISAYGYVVNNCRCIGIPAWNIYTSEIDDGIGD